MKRLFSIAGVLLGVCVGSASCSSSDRVFLANAPPPGVFGDPDSGSDAGTVEASLPESVPMCAVTMCSLPWATCPSSKFPCDVDLLNDDQNCGGCGLSCRPAEKGASEWACVAGRCTLACLPFQQNCDGDQTNGCETQTDSDRNNCGDCGIKCAAGSSCKQSLCVKDGCPDHAPDECTGNCTNLDSDDNNCGTCGNQCDPTGPNLPPAPASMHYGCFERKCGKLKCNSNTLDCNGNPADGCEATLGTAEHCNECYDTCAAGKYCLQAYSGLFVCLCDDNETLCPDGCMSLDDDPRNCGGCGRSCPGLSRPHFDATCTLGICSGKCADNHADCDGLPENGCEVDMRVDNRNCGACGNHCLPNQPCSEGKCVVAPCGTPGTEVN